MKSTKSKHTGYSIVFVALIPFLLSHCVIDNFDSKLKIVNNSNEGIFVTISENSSFQFYPIVIDSVTKDTLWDYTEFILPLDSTEGPPPTLGSWENYININCEDSILNIFIFDRSLLRNVKPDSLVLSQIFSKRYSLKVNDLQKIDWRILYK